MQGAISMARKVALTDATVLITGESGVGKELFARAIHTASPRCQGPFVALNCGAIPAALFESELFGYERGAFTGAEPKGSPGKLTLAKDGTLFLDEIGDLPLDLQVKLLRVLQEQSYYRSGGSKPLRLEARILAATNRSLERMIEEGTFRRDHIFVSMSSVWTSLLYATGLRIFRTLSNTWYNNLPSNMASMLPGSLLLP